MRVIVMIGDHDRDILIYHIGLDMDYDAESKSYKGKKGSFNSQCSLVHHPKIFPKKPSDALELEFGECVLGWPVIQLNAILTALDGKESCENLSVFKDPFGGATICYVNKWWYNRAYFSATDINKLKETASDFDAGNGICRV